MNKVFGYIINMLPYILISLPVILCIRFIILKINKVKKVNLYHEFALVFFIMFVVGLASQTIIPKLEFKMDGTIGINNPNPGGINIIPFKVLYDTYIEVFKNSNINYFVINFIGNIVMFMPFGFFIPLLFNNIKNKNVILIGLLSSLIIEICQLPLARGTDVDDLLLNTLGTALGLLIYNILNKRFQVFLRNFKNNI